MSCMKKNVSYKTKKKKKKNVRNKLRFKKKVDNNWAPRKTNWVKVKKNWLLGVYGKYVV